MKRSSPRPARSLVSPVLAASAALGALALLPSPVFAQAIGGWGQRSNSPRQQPQQQQAPVYTNPMVNNTPMMPTQNNLPPQNNGSSYRNNNAPVFSRPGGGYQAPPASVGPVLPSGPVYSPRPNIYPSSRGWRNNDGLHSAPRRTGPARGYENDSPSSSENAPIYGGHGDRDRSPSVRVTTPIGQRSYPRHYYNNDYLYSAPVTVVGGPALLGGYYYGNYSNTYAGQFCYPSVFSIYSGFPSYIVSPSLIVIGTPYYPVYDTSFLPFYTPTYQVTYNQNNYYVASEESVRDIEKGGEAAKQALKTSFPADSYQAAFADIEQAWNQGRISLLRKHLREDDVKLSVYFKGKYTYSIASGDFAQITRDAFDRLNTVSFRFTRLRKAKNGDVTAYGKHVYRTSSDDASRQDSSIKADDTVPFSTDGSRMYDNSDDPAPGEEKTVYVSYTLRHHDGQWYIIGVNSSPTDMVK